MESTAQQFYLLAVRLRGSGSEKFRQRGLNKNKETFLGIDRSMACAFFHRLPLQPGVWLPQHVHMGGQRLVRLQGDPLALQEVLLTAGPRETAGPCAHLNTQANADRRSRTHRYTQEK